MDSSDYLNYQKVLKQAEINSCNTKINTLNDECSRLETVKISLCNISDYLVSSNLSMEAKFDGVVDNSIWSGDEATWWDDNFPDIELACTGKLKNHIDLEIDSITTLINSKVSDITELMYKIYNLNCQIDTIDDTIKALKD